MGGPARQHIESSRCLERRPVRSALLRARGISWGSVRSSPCPLPLPPPPPSLPSPCKLHVDVAFAAARFDHAAVANQRACIEHDVVFRRWSQPSVSASGGCVPTDRASTGQSK